METQNQDSSQSKHWQNHGRGKVIGGLIIVAIGVMLLLRQMGFVFPEWIFSWEMILILVGFYIGVKHQFRKPSWIIFMLIGGLFLMDDIYPEITIGGLIWPILIIAFGLIIVFKPRRMCEDRYWKRGEHKWKDKWDWENAHQNTEGDSDMIETVSVFGAVKKNVISKNFKGGDVVCVFGGAEINLMQADFSGKAVLELTQVFGGTKLIVPAHWNIQNHDLVAVMGGIEDKRHVHKEVVIDADKTLVLRGTCFLGGIEINSYS